MPWSATLWPMRRRRARASSRRLGCTSGYLLVLRLHAAYAEAKLDGRSDAQGEDEGPNPDRAAEGETRRGDAELQYAPRHGYALPRRAMEAQHQAITWAGA